MPQPAIPGIQKPVSRIVLGTMIVKTSDMARSAALLDAALESGVNTFDTAIVYAGGDSERAIGRWMRERGVREKVVIVSKGCHPNQDRARVTPFDLASDVHDSLARLQTDYIDLYMFHRDEPAAPVGPLVEAMNELHAAGKIRAFGGSNWRHERIQEANEYAEKHGLVPFAASSPNYGLAEQVDDPWGPGCVSLSGPQNAAAREWHVRGQMPVFAYSSLGRGLFSGRATRENVAETLDSAARKAYAHEVNFRRLDRAADLARRRGATIPQIALAYVLTSPMNVFALVGAASPEECRAAVEAQNISLTQQERAWLDLAPDV